MARGGLPKAPQPKAERTRLSWPCAAATEKMASILRLVPSSSASASRLPRVAGCAYAAQLIVAMRTGSDRKE
eukprot:6111033-Prymnesium_polylepis.1